MAGRILIAALVALAGACGNEPPSPTPDGGVSELMPLRVGNRWEYRVTSSGGTVSQKIQSVTGTVAIGDVAAFRLLTERAGERETESVQGVVGGVLVRFSETGYRAGTTIERLRYEPPAVRIDSNHVRAGEQYQTQHKKITLDAGGNVLSSVDVFHTFTVEADAETVDVPAGRFTAVRVRRESSDSSVKTYWYAPGLGKVKETGGQTEELSKMTPGGS